MKKNKIILTMSVLFILVLGVFLSNKHDYKVLDKEISSDLSSKKIVVLGSEPEAITAAVMAARLGYSVDMITEDEKLGGLFTRGMLTALDLNYYNKNKILHEGFFREFYENASNGYNLDLNKTQNFFDEVVKHKNITLVKEVDDITPVVDSENKVIGVSYEKDGTINEIECDFVFDGSYEAEFTRKLGAKYKTGRSEFGKSEQYAAAGVMFSLKDVNWNEMKKAIEKEKDPETGVNGNAAWGFKQMYDYVPQDDIFKMRGLNISRQDDGSIVLNALLVIGVNPLDEASYSDVIERSKKEIPHIVEYMKQNLPGFENAKLDKIAESLYIREGVRIVGEETLDGYDIVAHTEFDDVIGYGSYPSDLQTATKEGYGNAMNGNSIYEVPLGVMMPKGIDNVLVLGRCASFDIVAHGSARTVPVLMSMAQGSVHAVDYALRNNLSLEEVRRNHMKEVHKLMIEDGKMIMPEMPKDEYEGHFAKDYIQHLRQKGLLTTKYFGTLPIDEKASMEQLKSIINLAREYTTIPFTHEQVVLIKNLGDNIEKNDIVKILSILTNKQYSTLEELKTDGVLSENTYNLIIDTNEITNGHIYAIMSDYIKYMQRDFVENIKTDKVEVIKK